ncbi:carboxypeptidase regulatory-like domain-containing protein [Bremerella sp. JC770]|uniref:carboxypeptidase regulatory-like domain-containing protein n=1 Tax=Bremerella sp. JC770 TaxID=3232137 RepID=UPI0034590890
MRPMPNCLLKLLIGLLMLAPLSGCGKESNVLPVTGKVTLDGKPLVGATVNFTPVDGPQRTTARGTIDEAGQYELRLTSQQKGALLGKHLVQIRFAPTGDNTTMKIPAKFNRKSELYAEVTREGTNSFDFDLTSR